jgi:hypothetical protein
LYRLDYFGSGQWRIMSEAERGEWVEETQGDVYALEEWACDCNLEDRAGYGSSRRKRRDAAKAWGIRLSGAYHQRVRSIRKDAELIYAGGGVSVNGACGLGWLGWTRKWLLAEPGSRGCVSVFGNSVVSYVGNSGEFFSISDRIEPRRDSIIAECADRVHSNLDIKAINRLLQTIRSERAAYGIAIKAMKETENDQ